MIYMFTKLGNKFVGGGYIFSNSDQTSRGSTPTKRSDAQPLVKFVKTTDRIENLKMSCNSLWIPTLEAESSLVLSDLLFA